MKGNGLIITGLVSFALTSILFGGLYLNQRTALKMKSDDLRIEIAENEELKQEIQTNSEIQPKQDETESLLGIYYLSDSTDPHNKMDIRSDGYVYRFFQESQGNELQLGKPAKWELENGILIIGSAEYRLEQNDLIDSRNRRWNHVR